PVAFLYLLNAAEFPQCLITRLFWTHPDPHVVLNLHVEMGTDFILQVSLHLSLQKQPAQAVDEESQPDHVFSSDGSRKRIMISDARRQLSSSAASCFFPARVIEEYLARRVFS